MRPARDTRSTAPSRNRRHCGASWGWARWTSAPCWRRLADTLGTFLHGCEPSSNLVFQKMKGNPIFVLRFLRSLEERRLPKYNAGERR